MALKWGLKSPFFMPFQKCEKMQKCQWAYKWAYKWAYFFAKIPPFAGGG